MQATRHLHGVHLELARRLAPSGKGAERDAVTHRRDEPVGGRRLLGESASVVHQVAPLVERGGNRLAFHPLERAAYDHAIALQLRRLSRPSVERRSQRAVLHASHNAGNDTTLPSALDRVHTPADEHRAHVALAPSDHEALSLANTRQPSLVLRCHFRLAGLDHVAPGFKRCRGAGTRDAPHRPRQHLPLARVFFDHVDPRVKNAEGSAIQQARDCLAQTCAVLAALARDGSPLRESVGDALLLPSQDEPLGALHLGLVQDLRLLSLASGLALRLDELSPLEERGGARVAGHLLDAPSDLDTVGAQLASRLAPSGKGAEQQAL